MAKVYRHASLQWPVTPDQWQALNDEFENIYRLLKTGNFGSGGGGATLVDTGVTPGTYGTASRSPTFTVNTTGQLTAASDQAIAIDGSQVTAGTVDPARLGMAGVAAYVSLKVV